MRRRGGFTFIEILTHYYRGIEVVPGSVSLWCRASHRHLHSTRPPSRCSRPRHGMRERPDNDARLERHRATPQRRARR